MTDKELARANEIKAELVGLEQLKRSLLSNNRVTINLDFYEDLRKSFANVVGDRISTLKVEFETL